MSETNGLLIIGPDKVTDRRQRAVETFAPSLRQLREVMKPGSRENAPSANALLDSLYGDLLFVRVRSPGPGKGPMHEHDCDQLLIVTSGRGLIATESEEHELGPGSVILVQAGEPHLHASTSDPGMETLYLTKAGYSTSPV